MNELKGKFTVQNTEELAAPSCISSLQDRKAHQQSDKCGTKCSHVECSLQRAPEETSSMQGLPLLGPHC